MTTKSSSSEPASDSGMFHCIACGDWWPATTCVVGGEGEECDCRCSCADGGMWEYVS